MTLFNIYMSFHKHLMLVNTLILIEGTLVELTMHG